MTLKEFLDYVPTRGPLNTEGMHRLMNEMSEEARRVTFRLNSAWHSQEEIRALLGELFGRPVPDTLRVFPPSIPISVRIFMWGSMCSLMLAAIFRITAA